MSGIAIAAMKAQRHLPEDAPADKPKRKPIPDHIPRVEVKLTPGNAQCGHCGGKVHRLGEDVTEELEYIPCPAPPPIGIEPITHQCRRLEPTADNGRNY